VGTHLVPVVGWSLEVTSGIVIEAQLKFINGHTVSDEGPIAIYRSCAFLQKFLKYNNRSSIDLNAQTVTLTFPSTAVLTNQCEEYLQCILSAHEIQICARRIDSEREDHGTVKV
jgi:hypothetical protein